MEGRVPNDELVDGHVVWTTCDHGYSYVPSISCGHFAICVNRGDEWGVGAGQGQASMERFDEEGESDGMPRQVDFGWTRERLRGACALIAAEQDHPNVQWVCEAADQLWEALQKEDAVRVRKFVLSVLPGTQRELEESWQRREETVYVGAVREALISLRVSGLVRIEADGTYRAAITQDEIDAALTANQAGRVR